MARPSTNVLQQTEQSGVVAARKLVAGYPVPVRAVYRHKPALLAQFDCNENCANMADGGRACVECLHLTSPMVRVLETQIYRMRAHCPIESTSSFPRKRESNCVGRAKARSAVPAAKHAGTLRC